MGNRRIAAQRRFDLWGRSGLYDALVGVSFGRAGSRLRHRLVDLLAPLDRARVLDVATGTGTILPHLAACVGQHGRVVGIDLSAGMLERARRRTAGLANVELVQADAARLPFPDASFDVALSTYGLSCIADIAPALRELARVVAPGGRVGIAEATTVNWGSGRLNRLATAIASPFNAWYPERDLEPLLREAGFAVRREAVGDGPLRIVVATRPGG